MNEKEKKGEGEKAEKIDNADLSYVPKAHV